MKKLILLVAVIAFAKAGYAQETEEWKDEVDQLLTEWHSAASVGDFGGYFDLTSEDFHFIGTDPTENWSRERFMEFSEPHFEDGGAWTFKSIERNIYFAGEQVAYFDEVLNSEHMGLCRGSGVLTRVDGEWKIAHYVLSLAIPNKMVESIYEEKHQIDEHLMEEILDR